MFWGHDEGVSPYSTFYPIRESLIRHPWPLVHQPADNEDRRDEADKAVSRVLKALPAGPFAHDAEYDGSKQGKQDANVEVGWMELQGQFLFIDRLRPLGMRRAPRINCVWLAWRPRPDGDASPELESSSWRTPSHRRSLRARPRLYSAIACLWGRYFVSREAPVEGLPLQVEQLLNGPVLA